MLLLVSDCERDRGPASATMCVRESTEKRVKRERARGRRAVCYMFSAALSFVGYYVRFPQTKQAHTHFLFAPFVY